jgi:adenosylcobinamide kinase/adenosylcobinamide-phosphate guanylyltransferase
MGLVLLVGGARSGKSALAVRAAASWPSTVAFIATAEAKDDDMTERIRRHRRARPSTWDTIEAPLELRAALAQVPNEACLIVDCLTVWVANLLERRWSQEAIVNEAAAAAGDAAARPSPTIVVSNEVGLGIVPENPLGRSYRDVLGRVNATFAATADDAHFVVAGRLVPLGPFELALGRAEDG